MWRLTLLCDVCGREFGTDVPPAPFSGVGQFNHNPDGLSETHTRACAIREGWKRTRKGQRWHCRECVKIAQTQSLIPAEEIGAGGA